MRLLPASWLGGRGHRWLERLGTGAAVAGLFAQTAVGAVLAVALLVNDFRLAYVAQMLQPALALVLCAVGILGRPGRLAAALVMVGRRAGNRLSLLGRKRGERRAESGEARQRQTDPAARIRSAISSSPCPLVSLSPPLPLSPLPSPLNRSGSRPSLS